MVDQLTVPPELSRVTKDMFSSINELASKVSALTSAIKETFPAVDKTSSYVNRLASAFGQTSISATEFTNKIYEMGKSMIDVVDKIKTERGNLINTVNAVVKAYESLRGQTASQLTKFRDDLSHLIGTLTNESRRLSGTLADNSAKYRDFRILLTNLEKVVHDVLSGTIPSNINEVVRSFQEVSQSIGVLRGGTSGLVSASETSIEMVKDLRDLVLDLSKRSKDLIMFGDLSKEATQKVKDSFKSYLQSVEPLTKHNEVLKKQYDILKARIEKIDAESLLTSGSITELVKSLDELKTIAEETVELVKEYSKSTVEFVVWQHIANDAFKRFSEKMAQLPKSVQTIATSIGKLVLNVVTFVRSIMTGASSIIDAAKSLAEFVKTILEAKKTAVVLAGIAAAVIAALRALYEAGMRVIGLTVEVTKSFGDYVFGLRDVRKFTFDLMGSWSSLVYSTETVIKAISDVINVFIPLGETFESVTKRGVGDIISFSMTIDRFARSIGTTASELSDRLVKFASYFGYNLREIINSGRKGASTVLQMYSNFAGYVLRRIRLTMTDVMQIFSGVFERIMWMGSQFSSINSQLMTNVVSAIAAAGKTFSLTVEHSRKLAGQFAEIISGTTWDMYAGILAATGRWTGSLDEMVRKALVTTPFEKARETAVFFMDIAKYNAGLKDTWLAFVPQFREIIRRFPEEIDVLREAVETWVRNRNIDFRDALARSGLSVDKIDEMMLVMDSLGNPLQTLITLVKRILDKLSLIAGRLSSPVLTGLVKAIR
jgi:predicted  nucleic acid-binding Zn-ribbon protein